MKYKPKLQKLVEEDSQEPFYPTQQDCIKWFRIVNREIFNSKLRLLEFDIRERKLTHAYFYYDDEDFAFKPQFHINSRYDTKKRFVEILAHEMVHQYQYLYEKGNVAHNQSFWSWKPKFAKYKLALKERY